MADSADGMAMFSATKQPPALSEACLQSLCASLNAPIVHMDDLPAGPARCAAVVYAEQYGDIGASVAVRSLEGGEVVVMRVRETLPPDADPKEALEMAISFAEGLGFVFDDDMLSGHPDHARRLAALDHWLKLIGSDEVFAASDVASPPVPAGRQKSPEPERMPEMEDLLSAAAVGDGDEEPVAIELEELSIGDLEEGGLGAHRDELLLDDIAPLAAGEDADLDHELEIDGVELEEALPAAVEEAAAPIRTNARRRTPARATAEVTEPIEYDEAPIAGAEAVPGEQAFAASPLSKFRRPDDVDDVEDADEAAAGGSALGRVKIVRMRKSKDGRAPARGRILASY